MGNVGLTLKRFFTNKNTVTLVAIIVCVFILYFFYRWRVNSAVTTTSVCYATQTIPAREPITDEMVSTKDVLASAVSDNMIKDCGDVIGKDASYASEIPANSFFYKENVIDPDDMPNAAFNDIPDNYTIYNLAVDNNSTYANSIFPDSFIDLYLKTQDANGTLIYGKFIQSIKVLAVKDADGNNVFETTQEKREPANMLFAVPDDLYLLLKKAEYLGIEIVIVPRNSNYTAEANSTLVSSDYLKQLVIDQTVTIPDECVKSTTNTAECKADDATTDDSSESSQSTQSTQSTRR